MTLSHVMRTVSKPIGLFVAALGFAFCAFVLPASSASAAVCTFTSAGTSDFNDVANWDCGSVPGAADNVIIPGAEFAALSAPVSVLTVQILSTGTLSTSGFDLTVENAITDDGSLIANDNMITIGTGFYVTGSFAPGNGTVTFTGPTQTTVTGTTFNNLVIDKGTSGAVNFTLGTSILVLGDFTQLGQTNFIYNNQTLEVRGDVLFNGGSVQQDGILLLTGGADQVLTSVQAASVIMSKSGGTASVFLNSALLTDVLQLTGGTFDMSAASEVRVGMLGGSGPVFLISGGTFISGTGGQFSYWGNSAVDIAATTYPNLFISPTTPTVYSLIGPVVVESATRIETNATIDIGTTTYTSNGAFVNFGHITEGVGGSIIHPADEFTFVRVGETIESESDFTSPDIVRVSLWDPNHNLDGSAIETVTVPVSLDATAGSDSESLVLTETGPATGQFRSGPVNLVASTAVSPNNNQFEILATGLATSLYVDPQDAADAPTATATFHYFVFPTQGGGGGNGGGGSGGGSGSSGGSGGGGLGAPEVQALAPVVTHYESYQANPGSTPSGSVAGTSTTDVTPFVSLMKLENDNNPDTQMDTTVWFVGTDGKRHAFTNEKVYFTWYSDYAQVRIVTLQELMAIPVGANATYKAGVKMVKFTADDKSYAVSKNGVLGWVKTEEVAAALYGESWTTKVDDINSTFMNDYAFGSDIASVLDYNPTTAMLSAQTANDGLKI
ncbi:MAG: hypothetical protein ABIO72_03785 [Patescibacteria group bacterium]